MTPRRPDIVGLDWDERNEQHVEDHIPAWLVDEMIDGGDWFAFRNYRGHPPEHRLFVGRAPGGVFVTAVLREPTDDAPGVWRPITAWYSTDAERQQFRSEQKRTGRSHG